MEERVRDCSVTAELLFGKSKKVDMLLYMDELISGFWGIRFPKNPVGVEFIL